MTELKPGLQRVSFEQPKKLTLPEHIDPSVSLPEWNPYAESKCVELLILHDPVRLDLAGQRIGALTVRRRLNDIQAVNQSKTAMLHWDQWECVCFCGNVVQKAGTHLRREKQPKSCGCALAVGHKHYKPPKLYNYALKIIQ